MSDEAWRTHERRWRQVPSDQDALGRAIAGMRRSGLVVPPDLLDARIEPATSLTTTLPLELRAVLPGEREPTTVGWGPGTIPIPPHRYWGVGDVPAGVEGLGALGDELRARAIPGLRLRELAYGRSQDPHVEEGLRLDPAALAALGPQPHLRWLELRTYSQVSPGQVVRALGCLGLEVLQSDGLQGQDEENRAPLEGLPDLVHLRELELTRCHLAAEDLRGLEALPHLEALGLCETGLGLAELSRAPSLPLRRVQLSRFDDADGRAALELSRLTSVRLSGMDLTPRRARALAALPALDELVVHQSPYFPEPLDEALAQFRTTRLSTLAVTGTPASMSDAGLAAVLTIETLRSLRIDGSHTHADTGHALRFDRLRSLSLTCQGPCLGAVGRAVGLRSLSLRGVPPALAMRAVGGLLNLEHLELSPPGNDRSSDRRGPLRLPALRRLSTGVALDRVEAPLRSLQLLRSSPDPVLHGLGDSVRELQGLLAVCRLDSADAAQLERLEDLSEVELLLPDQLESSTAERLLNLVRRLPRLRRLAVRESDLPEEPRSADWGALDGALSTIRRELPWIRVVESIYY